MSPSTEQWTSPMCAIYDKPSRSICVDDPSMNTVSARNEDSLFFEPGIDDDEDIFAFDAGRTLSEQEIQQADCNG